MRTLRNAARLALFSGLILSGSAAPTAASTITWEYQGQTLTDVFSLPAGTLVTLSWTFDPATANFCAGSQGGVGWYTGMGAMTVTLGALVYQAPVGGVAINVAWQGACGAVATGIQEAILGPFVGPGLTGATIYPGTVAGAYGFLSLAGPVSPLGAFPLEQPEFARLNGPFFCGLLDCGSTVNGVVANLHAVPEPATLLLLGTGIAAVALRRLKRRT